MDAVELDAVELVMVAAPNADARSSDCQQSLLVRPSGPVLPGGNVGVIITDTPGGARDQRNVQVLCKPV
ncbi:MAG: hypothetical protein ACRDT6_14215 [Micromonosporaceae bacterium]